MLPCLPKLNRPRKELPSRLRLGPVAVSLVGQQEGGESALCWGAPMSSRAELRNALGPCYRSRPHGMEAVNLIAALGCGNCFLQSSVTSTKTTKRCRGWTAEFRGGDEFPLGVTRTGRWTSEGVSGVRQESNPRALNESIPSHREKAFAQPRERLSGRFTPLDTNERSWMAHMLTSAIADG